MTHAQNSNYASPDHKPFKDKKKKLTCKEHKPDCLVLC